MKFGVRERVANFSVLKFSRTVSKKELSSMRAQMDLPVDVQKRLVRVGLPVIKVSAISGLWSIEFCSGTNMFRLIDEKVGVDNASLESIFVMMFTDTTILGDREYFEKKGEALMDFLSRRKGKELSEEDDLRILKEEERKESDFENVLNAAEQVSKAEEGEKDGE